MRPFHCSCGGTVFFENSQCLTCQKELGWCPACCSMTPLERDPNGNLKCANTACEAALVKCHNYEVEQVCNRCMIAPDETDGSPLLCDYCRFNETIPDLDVAGNRELWRRLETAKRRLLYTLDLLQLPYGTAEDGVDPPLSFDFKADATRSGKWWWSVGKDERVYTGHADGKITINLREADPVEREKNRINFQEAHRTVIGHFRHEVGHYYWQMLIPGRCDAEFKEVFGDHQNPTYADAQQRYYQDGPLNDWQGNFISAYATMHPWEDFAETFATYLDMVSVLDTAFHMGVYESLDPTTESLQKMVDHYVQLGLVLNELNRAMGLLDVVPEIFAPSIVAKLNFVHDLLRQARR